MIPMMASTMIYEANTRAEFGKRPRLKRSSPYVPIFNKTPARITEPAVGASVCASGNQVCNGNSGTLIQNAKAKAANRKYSLRGANGLAVSAWISVG